MRSLAYLMAQEAFSLHNAFIATQTSLIAAGLPNTQTVLGNSSFLQVCIAINVITNLPSVANLLINSSNKRLTYKSNLAKANLTLLLESKNPEDTILARGYHTTIKYEYDKNFQSIESVSKRVFWWFQQIGNLFAFIALILIYFEYYVWFDFLLALTWVIYVSWLYFFVSDKVKNFSRLTAFSESIQKQYADSKVKTLQLQKNA